jgi:transcription termination factor NusB
VSANLLPFQKYAWRNIGQDYNSTDKNANTNTNPNENNSEKRAANETKLSFLLDNPLFSLSKKATEKEEKNLFVGIFNDVFKNIPRLLTGSLLTDVIKTLYKNADLTWQEAIYKNLLDSGPSRLFNDVLNSLIVRFLNGNHSFLWLFKLPYLAPEIASQITSPVMVTLMRALTSKSNPNAKSARNNPSPEQLELKKTIVEKNRVFLRLVKSLGEKTMNQLKPHMDRILSLIGVHAGEIQKDKEGRVIYERAKNGKLKRHDDGTPKLLYTNQRINKGLLGGVVAGSYLGSFLLPRHTAAFGFEEAKNIPRMITSTLFTTFCRLNTTMLHNGVGMHVQGGANFDHCFRTSLVEKLLVPFTQYFSDAMGSFLAGKVPINGAVLATTLRLITEIPATFLSNGLINIAKEDRLDDEWTYVAHKIWKPVVDATDMVLRPVFNLICKGYGVAFGMYDPSIKNMYGKDIRNEATKAKDKLPQEILDKFKDNTIIDNLKLFMKKSLAIPKELIKLKESVVKHSDEVEAHIQNTVDKRNHNIDLRLVAEAVLEKAGLESFFRPRTSEPEINEKIIQLASTGLSPDELEKEVSNLFTPKLEENKTKLHKDTDENIPKLPIKELSPQLSA